jgi:preprotein translocase subunit SecG
MAFLFAPCFLVAWIVARIDLERIWTGTLRERMGALKFLISTKNMLVGGIVACLLFLPWLPTFFKQLSASKNISSLKTPAKVVDLLTNIQIFLIGTPKGELSPWSMNPNVLAGISTATLSILIIIALTLIGTRLLHRSSRKTLMLLSFFMGPLLLSYALSFFDKYYFISRYVFPAAYALFVLLGYWLSTLPYRSALVASSLYVITLLLIQPLQNSEGYNALSSYLSEYPGSHFYSLNTFDYMLAKYYVGADRLTPKIMSQYLNIL